MDRPVIPTDEETPIAAAKPQLMLAVIGDPCVLPLRVDCAQDAIPNIWKRIY